MRAVHTVMDDRIATLPRRLAGLRTEAVLGLDVLVAETATARLLGLSLLGAPPPLEGLLIPSCRSIHTFGMHFDLEVVFLDGRRRPLRRIERLGPGRVRWHIRAAAVLEIPLLGEGARSDGPGSHMRR